VNLSTTRAIEDIAEQYGARVIRTAVGEINVSKRMREENAIIGGEGSGGVILPSVHMGRDSLVGVALALSALADFDGPISAKRKEMPNYEIEKSRIDLTSQEQVRSILEKLKVTFEPESTAISMEDGLRLDFERSWLHARSSNTEPIIRLIAEAPSRQEAEAILVRARRAIE
jgi:phosphomannomutase